MANNDLPFYTQTAVLDTYIKMGDLSSLSEIVTLIAKYLREKPELYNYFFLNRPNPAWAKALLLQGFFEKAPDLIKQDESYLAPRWEEQEYLIYVAKQVPEVVVEHIRKIKGHGHYYDRAIKALEVTPPEMIEGVIPIILDWLDDLSIAPIISLNVLSLIKVLASNKRRSAFSLFQKITTPYPSNEKLTSDNYFLRSSAISVFPLDDYDERTLLKTSAELQQLDINETISILESQLCEALRLEAETTNDLDYKDRSFWRSAIEDTGQDIVTEYKDVLLVALRNALEQTVENNIEEINSLIRRYLADSHEILRRLGLHILSQFPDRFKELVTQELLNNKNMDDVGIHHEYFILLRNGYPHLETNEQRQLINAVIVGLSKERLNRIAEWMEDKSEEEREKYAVARSKVWIRDRLWMLKDYLEDEPKVLLDSLLEEFGSPDHPSFTHWTSGAYPISDVSPVTAEDLRQKSNEDLLEFLMNWKPSRGSFGPEEETYGALGEEVAKLILSDIERYTPNINEIVSIHSGFATSLLYAHIPENFSFQSALDLYLNISEYLLSNKQIRTSLEETASGNWVSFRFAIVGIFEKLLTDEKAKLTEIQWIRIRDLLIILVDDPDPDLERDRPGEGWFGNNDPLSVAINHVRPEALLSLIYYANHVASEDFKNRNENTTLELESIIKEVLSAKVKRENDFSLAVHSVFGRELNRLYWMDKKWVEDNIDEIFPVDDDEESIAFYVAAWDSYVSNHQINLELFDLLRPRYERSIENVSKGYITKTFNPVNALAHHLLLEYQLAKYHINSQEGQNSLIAKFFNQCLPDHRGEAVWALSQRTQSNKQEWQRAKELWTWRLEVASNANHSRDFKSEMASFSHLLLAAPETESITTLWALLEGLLPYIQDSKGWNRIWRNLQTYLANEVERDPVGTIRFYSLMHEELSEPRPYYEYHKDGRKIIEGAASNRDSRYNTLLLIDKLERGGNYEFRDIRERILSLS